METKRELFSEDILRAIKHADFEDVNDLGCTANDAAAQVYQAYYDAHPGCEQLPEMLVDENGIEGWSPAVDAAMAVYQQFAEPH